MTWRHEQPTHEDLLTLARKAEAAAGDGDRERLEAAGLRLFQALVAHLGDEDPRLDGLAPADARILRRGQQRIVDTVVDLTAGAGLAGDARCRRLAGILVAELELQARDEQLRLGPLA